MNVTITDRTRLPLCTYVITADEGVELPPVTEDVSADIIEARRTRKSLADIIAKRVGAVETGGPVDVPELLVMPEHSHDTAHTHDLPEHEHDYAPISLVGDITILRTFVDGQLSSQAGALSELLFSTTRHTHPPAPPHVHDGLQEQVSDLAETLDSLAAMAGQTPPHTHKGYTTAPELVEIEARFALMVAEVRESVAKLMLQFLQHTHSEFAKADHPHSQYLTEIPAPPLAKKGGWVLLSEQDVDGKRRIVLEEP